jgi:hypothetical protein
MMTWIAQVTPLKAVLKIYIFELDKLIPWIIYNLRFRVSFSQRRQTARNHECGI